MSKIMCEECFALIEECDCELPIFPNPPIYHVNARCKAEPKRKSRSDKWEPNIKPNEKWFKVESDYTAYKE